MGLAPGGMENAWFASRARPKAYQWEMTSVLSLVFCP